MHSFGNFEPPPPDVNMSLCLCIWRRKWGLKWKVYGRATGWGCLHIHTRELSWTYVCHPIPPFSVRWCVYCRQIVSLNEGKRNFRALLRSIFRSGWQHELIWLSHIHSSALVCIDLLTWAVYSFFSQSQFFNRSISVYLSVSMRGKMFLFFVYGYFFESSRFSSPQGIDRCHSA